MATHTECKWEQVVLRAKGCPFDEWCPYRTGAYFRDTDMLLGSAHAEARVEGGRWYYDRRTGAVTRERPCTLGVAPSVYCQRATEDVCEDCTHHTVAWHRRMLEKEERERNSGQDSGQRRVPLWGAED